MEIDNRNELVRPVKKTTVRRVTAEKHIEMVLTKIKEVNDNPYYLYFVDKVVLFGSYINSNKDILGDVDIAIYLSQKIESDELFKVSRERAYEHGVYNVINALGYAREEVLRYVKNRKISISLHDGDEADYESKACNEKMSYIYLNKHKVIYLRTAD
ncbi:MAG: hypothetical protein K0S01_94 [Herbinix sp.]|jgi:predicted nucleotidyltransferase|nr:hypothetical protein [Herbinix sp.]